jgi:hypothetical protein
MALHCMLYNSKHKHKNNTHWCDMHGYKLQYVPTTPMLNLKRMWRRKCAHRRSNDDASTCDSFTLPCNAEECTQYDVYEMHMMNVGS